MRGSLPVLAVTLLVLAATAADATVIAQYDFTGSSLASSDVEPNSTAGSLVLEPTTLLTPNGNPLPGLLASFAYSFSGGTNLAPAATLALTPTAGFELNLTSLQLDGSSLYIEQAVPMATYYAAVRSNLDGFVSNIAVASWGAANNTPGFVALTLDLSAAAFQGLSAADLAGVGGSLELRLYFGMSNSADVGTNAVVDNFVVNGTTSVPEPSASALLAAALLALGLAYCSRPQARIAASAATFAARSMPRARRIRRTMRQGRASR